MPARSQNPPTVLLPHRAMRNIYVRELGRAYASLGFEPLFGQATFFESDFVPDLLHLHWPEEAYRAPQEGTLGERVDCFLERLDRLREMGTRIIWTVHNLRPHEIASSELEHEAYQGVIDRAHVVHHHCADSQSLLRAQYRIPDGQTHFVAPIGHYLAYPNTISREEARASLGIDPSSFVYLHFGLIRGYKGLDLVEAAFKGLEVRRKHLVVAGRVSLPLTRMERIRFFAHRTLQRHTTYVLQTIRNDEVQRYLQASDAVVLGHTAGLNSAVAVLGMTFGKPVVGPRLGCIRWTLEQGVNVLYEPCDVRSLEHAMESVTHLDPEEAGSFNRRIAAGWTWDAIASRAVAASTEAAAPISNGRRGSP